jgi:hypothetical protein
MPLRDAWVIWFILGVVMLNYPFLHIFNKSVLIGGIPLTLLYFFVGWPISIFVIYLFATYLERYSSLERNGQDHDDNEGSA